MTILWQESLYWLSATRWPKDPRRPSTMVQGTGSPGSVCRSTSPRSRGQPAAIRSKAIQNMSEWFLQDASIEPKVQAFLDQTPVVNIGSSWIGWIQHHAFFTVLVRTRPMARHDFGSRKIRRGHPLKPGTTWLPAEAVCPCLTHAKMPSPICAMIKAR